MKTSQKPSVVKPAKTLASMKPAHRKPSFGSGLIGKENINLVNAGPKAGITSIGGKECSPKLASTRQGSLAVDPMDRKPTLRRETADIRGIGSHDKQTSSQKKRSLTPNSIKEVIDKMKLQNFHFSPKETFKIAFAYRSQRSGSPQGAQFAKKLEYNYKSSFKGSQGSSSPKSRKGFGNTLPLGQTQTSTTETEIIGYPGELSSQTVRGSFLQTASSTGLPLSHRGQLVYTAKCVNHDSRRSKFYLVHPPSDRHQTSKKEHYDGVCSKCAVRLANMGWQVEEIAVEGDLESSRRVRHFDETIKASAHMIKSALKVLESKSSALKEHHDLQIETIETILEEVCSIVERVQFHALSIKRVLTEEVNEELRKLYITMEELKQQESQMLVLRTHLSRDQSELQSTDRVKFEKTLSDFNQKLSITVGECRRVCESRTQASQVTAPEGASLRLLEQKLLSLLKPKKLEIFISESLADEMTKAFGKINEIENTFRGRLTAQSSFDTESSREIPQEKNVYVSFDNNNLCDSDLMIDDRGSGDRPTGLEESSSKHFTSILERIDESQVLKDHFYTSIGLSDREVFMVKGQDSNFSEKQTPELGVKDQTPTYLQDQFAQMHRQYQQVSMQKKVDQHKAASEVFGNLEEARTEYTPLTFHPTTADYGTDTRNGHAQTAMQFVCGSVQE